MYAGTIGFFTFMMFLFIRFLPVINIFEIKDLLYKIAGDNNPAVEPVQGKVLSGGG
jgi:molybdopterin-containing oxidoreductase family membrane subunit